MSSSPAARRLRAGTVGRPHGLDGSFHVGAVVTAVFERLRLDSDVEVAGRSWRIVRLAGHVGRPIVRLDGLDSRDDAATLAGQDILIARSDAPALEPDEWWAEDLQGCAVRDGDREVGVVATLMALPSCEVLEVHRIGAGDRPALLVPLVRDAVRHVDVEARVIDIDLAFLGET